VSDADIETIDRALLHGWAANGSAAEVRRIAVLIARDRVLKCLEEQRRLARWTGPAEVVDFQHPPR
jgi:hypothetical protein